MNKVHHSRSVPSILDGRSITGRLSSKQTAIIRDLYDSSLVIESNTDFFQLVKSQTICDQTSVEFVGLGDIKPNEYPKFPRCKTLKLTRCDKNFVYYWLHSDTFPSLETVILWSHPGHRMVYYNFPVSVKWIVHPEWIMYASITDRHIKEDINAPPLYKRIK